MREKQKQQTDIRRFGNSSILQSAKRGSALLIVLGMLSVMVISAVGFSIYMRQSRLPSSYLRRNVASRYLVKAALAKAIDNLEGGFMSRYEIGIDEDNNNGDSGLFYGLYDDAYPGAGPDDTSAKNQYQTGQREVNDRKLTYCENGDYWYGRVFCPFGLLPYPQSEDRAISEPLQTVPTLTLEALAYLPPAIADTVRMYSRRTRTALWQTMPYEAGRYAYTVVNVSDMFDINRLQASVARNSGPDKITLATLTSNDSEDPSKVEQGRADQLERALGIGNDGARSQLMIGGQETCFTSLADFTLFSSGMSFSPFSKYVGSTMTLCYGDTPEVANGLYITDTWFPASSSATNTVYDLAGGHQPFDDPNWQANSFMEVLLKKNARDQVGDVFEKNLGIGLVALYDYLDGDSVPMSLALPTVEATPMVVGVSAPAGLQPDVGDITSVDGSYETGGYYFEMGENGQQVKVPTKVTIKRTCKQKGLTSLGNNVIVKGMTTFPFKRMKTTNRMGSFKYRGIMRVWLGSANTGCRPGSDVLYPLKADVLQMSGNGWSAANGVATFVTDSFAGGSALSAFNFDVTTTDQAVDDSMQLVFRSVSNVKMPVYWQVTEEIQQTMPGKTLMVDPSNKYHTQPYRSMGGIDGLADALKPINDKGAIDGQWLAEVRRATFNIDKDDGVTEMTAIPGNYRLFAAVWIQILDANGKVVDMAPACLADDNEWLNANVPENGVTTRLCGDGAPLLSFMADQDIAYDDTLDQKLGTAPNFSAWKSLYAVDPRYNFAPEDWFMSPDTQVSKGSWMSQIGLQGSSSQLLGQGGRDRDIFMFVSDQEYLQSVGELQFLPRVSEMRGADNFTGGTYSPDFHGRSFAERSSPTSGQFANGNRFWKTYSAYPLNAGMGTDDINPYYMIHNGKEVTIKSGESGFKVTPFSQDNRVLAAALVNTPFDYYVASTNDQQRQQGAKQNTLIRNIDLNTAKATYSFGDSSVARFEKDRILDIMDAMRDRFANLGQNGDSFEDVWDDFVWQSEQQDQINDNNKRFFSNAIQLNEPLHGVDRKFLYSFWRECFANRQQLFLVFVRAEPTSVGGGAIGSTSSAQLGGRAVALVWRDPLAPTRGGTRPDRRSLNSRQAFRNMKSETPPHRTRVLFYHQFD